jgi:hypothetical protein
MRVLIRSASTSSRIIQIGIEGHVTGLASSVAPEEDKPVTIIKDVSGKKDEREKIAE